MSQPSLANYWHPIAPIAEITAAPRAYTLLGARIVAFRAGEGARVFDDLCIHRGTALSLGSVEGDRLICAYHGWRFDGSGRCVHIPSLPAGAAIPRKARLVAHRVEEANGLVWVALDEPAQPVPGWTDDAWNNPDYRVFLAGDYVWNASAGRAIENAMDLAHLNFVHKGLTELGDGPVVKPHDVPEVAHGLEYAYEDGRLRREYRLYAPFTLHDKKLVVRADRGGTWSEAGRSRRGDASILSFIASPIDDTRCRFFVFIARNHALDVDDAAFGKGLDEIMEQDRRIVESQRPEALPVGLREELHLKVPDAVAIAYRRLLGRVGPGGPVTPRAGLAGGAGAGRPPSRRRGRP